MRLPHGAPLGIDEVVAGAVERSYLRTRGLRARRIERRREHQHDARQRPNHTTPQACPSRTPTGPRHHLPPPEEGVNNPPEGGNNESLRYQIRRDVDRM